MSAGDWLLVFTGLTAAATVITGLVAVIGIILQIRWNTKRLRIDLDIGRMTLPQYVGSPVSELRLLITARNIGRVSVPIASFSVQPKKSEKRIVPPQSQSEHTLPYTLEAGTRCVFWMPLSELKQCLSQLNLPVDIEVIGMLTDQADQRYQSKPVRFDIEAWLKNGSN